MMLRMHIVDTRFQTAELYFPHSQAVRKFPSVQELPGLTRGGSIPAFTPFLDNKCPAGGSSLCWCAGRFSPVARTLQVFRGPTREWSKGTQALQMATAERGAEDEARDGSSAKGRVPTSTQRRVFLFDITTAHLIESCRSIS
eukprot:m.13043 g.13043  ORF g.13043 m.13043 type:complete len:142 (-) comp18728_c0_seq2:52-477(-)